MVNISISGYGKDIIRAKSFLEIQFKDDIINVDLPECLKCNSAINNVGATFSLCGNFFPKDVLADQVFKRLRVLVVVNSTFEITKMAFGSVRCRMLSLPAENNNVELKTAHATDETDVPNDYALIDTQDDKIADFEDLEMYEERLRGKYLV